MIKKESLTKNFILQFVYQGLILVVPLILSPYLTRTLQETALGIYSFSNSVAYYFILVAMLGISRYGQRIISQNANEETELRRVFWSLYCVHSIVSLISVIGYIFFVLFFVQENKLIYLIQTFYVLSALCDITWLFYGLENFKSVVVKNSAVKIVECIAIFSIVKSPDDLWKYTMITSLGLLIGQMVMIPQAICMLKPIRITRQDILQHIKPLLVFSVSVIAVSLYTVFDKLLLGILSDKENVAFYEYSNRIITIPKAIIGVIGTVMFPRACRQVSHGDIEGQKKFMNYSFRLTSFIGVGSIFGLLAVGTPFAMIYYGERFKVCGSVIMALSPLILIIGIGDIIRTQYMVPNHMDKQFNICIIINAVINLVLSTSLIPLIGIYGAVIGTISAETFGIIYQLMICRKNISFRDICRNAYPFVIFGVIMFIVIKIIQSVMETNLKGILIQVLLGAFTYMVLSVLYIILFQRNLIQHKQ